MKIDGAAESLLVAKAAASDLDSFDSTVDAFGRAVSNVQDNGIEDAPEMLFDRLGNLFHRIETAADGPG